MDNIEKGGGGIKSNAVNQGNHRMLFFMYTIVKRLNSANQKAPTYL